MATDGNDPKGRGRRLFGSRRRQVQPPEPQADKVPEAAPEPSSGGDPIGGRFVPPAVSNSPEPAPESASDPDVPLATDEVTNIVESAENGQAEDGEVRSEAPAPSSAPVAATDAPVSSPPASDATQARAEGGRVGPPVASVVPPLVQAPPPVPVSAAPDAPDAVSSTASTAAPAPTPASPPPPAPEPVAPVSVPEPEPDAGVGQGPSGQRRTAGIRRARPLGG